MISGSFKFHKSDNGIFKISIVPIEKFNCNGQIKCFNASIVAPELFAILNIRHSGVIFVSKLLPR